MKKYPLILAAAIASVVVILNSCNKEPLIKALSPTLPAQPYNYVATQNSFVIFGSGDNTPFDNVMSNNGATLGRVLFYDGHLSINNTTACASCHKQQFAFADNKALSEGFERKLTSRNSLGIINAAAKANFFWDGRSDELEEQSLMPIANHIEMGLERLDVLEKKLAQQPYYADLFNKAFGTPEITREKISAALAQFMRSIVSDKSKVDVGSGMLSPQEMHGSQIFFDNCSDCHRGVNFGGAPIFNPYTGGGGDDDPKPGGGGDDPATIANIADIGLDVEYADAGVGALLNKPNLNGHFVIPSLRNIEVTGPYMHDGRFKTLEEVVEHYNSGVQANANLDALLKENGMPKQMHLNEQDKKDLVAFLKTLTDHSILTDKKYSNPFK